MSSKSPFGDIALKARVADLSNRLAQAEAALREAADERERSDSAGVSLQDGLSAAKSTLAMERLLLGALVDIFPDHIFVRDREGRHLLNNRAHLEVLGAKTLDETMGKTDFEYYPAEVARRYQAENERIMESGLPQIAKEELVQGPGGEQLWLSTTKVPFHDSDGNVIGIIGIARDITEQRLAVQKITEQAAMLDQARDIIIQVGLDGRYAYWNKAAERALGWTAAEAIGRKADDIFPKEDLESLRLAMIETLASGEWQGETFVHDKAGLEIHLDTRRTLIRDARGAPRTQLSISSDITERKRNEAQALRNQRLESIGTLAGGIAHDLNNVLAPILMAIALLKTKVSDEGGERLLAMLEQNATRGAQLVRQVLAFGRGAEGNRILVQPHYIAREIEQIVKDTFPKSIDFALRGERNSWTVTGDPTQIHQVLLNLCVNARDAMPNGGRIVLQIENMNLDETYASMNPGAKAGRYLALSVSDTGTGIPDSVRDRIFEPFFTTKDIGLGTGLGLSTSLGIVRSHGGFMNVTSEVGKGSTFTVFIPANAEAAAKGRSAAAARMELPRGHNELILVVDDETPILSVAKTTLERFGYRVLVASNGAEAVSLYALHKDTIAVVLTDMAMPVMDGPTMTVALRAINPDVRIIGSSGLGASGSLAGTANAGVIEFMTKPYSAEMLLTSIERVIRGREAGADQPPHQAGPDAPGA